MIVGICRFSYLTEGGWKKTPTGLEEAKQHLFNTARMESRFALFERLLVPSIACQTDKDFKLIILASEFMPEKYKQRLLSVTAGISNIIVRFEPPAGKQREAVGRVVLEALGDAKERVSFRIDDDDGLAADFVQRLRRDVRAMVTGFDGPPPFLVSFAAGLLVQSAPNVTEWGARCSLPFTGAGLALYSAKRQGLSIHDVAHFKCYTRFDVLVRSGPPAFIRTINDFNDSKDATEELTDDEINKLGGDAESKAPLSDFADEFPQQFPYLLT